MFVREIKGQRFLESEDISAKESHPILRRICQDAWKVS